MLRNGSRGIIPGSSGPGTPFSTLILAGRRLRGKAFYNVGEKVYCQEDFLVSESCALAGAWVGAVAGTLLSLMETRGQEADAGWAVSAPLSYNILDPVSPSQYSGFQQTADKCSVCGHLIMEMVRTSPRLLEPL